MEESSVGILAFRVSRVMLKDGTDILNGKSEHFGHMWRTKTYLQLQCNDKKMPYTDQITYIALHVRTFFWDIIYYEYFSSWSLWFY